MAYVWWLWWLLLLAEDPGQPVPARLAASPLIGLASGLLRRGVRLAGGRVSGPQPVSAVPGSDAEVVQYGAGPVEMKIDYC